MFKHPPREKAWLSWLAVVAWTLVIYFTIPFARRIQAAFAEAWGRPAFTYVVLAFIAVACAAALVYLFRASRGAAIGQYVWLFLAGGTSVYFTLRLAPAPEESLHFIEYGILALLVFRALSHGVRDPLIYLNAWLICAIIGSFDEVIQWMTPRRFFAFGDIALNALASGLMIVGLAGGLRPPFINQPVRTSSVRWACALTSVALVVLGLCASNTPGRVARYTDRFPALAFLENTTSQMAEYGYRYEDPEIGIFFSRMTPAALGREDARRGEEAARILDKYGADTNYAAFLAYYTPHGDPFLHEIRVHLFRRDHYLAVAPKHAGNDADLRFHCTVAYRENQILEKYFSNALFRSAYVLAPQQVDKLRPWLDEHALYKSEVSSNLITRLSERRIWMAIVAGIIALLTLGSCHGRFRRPSGEVP